jgi:cholesterol oxidase
MARLTSRASEELQRYGEPASMPKPGLQFTEHMAGYFAPGAADFQQGWAAGKAQGSAMSVVLTIHINAVDDMVRDEAHRAEIAGTVDCHALSAHPLTVSSGEFRLFTIDRERVGTREMSYTLHLTSVEGARYLLSGRKEVRDDPGFDLWADTTTLSVVVATDAASAPVEVGRGILRIGLTDLVRLMASMRATNAPRATQKVGAYAAFGRFFGGTLVDTYGGVLARADVRDALERHRTVRPLALPPAEMHAITTDDGVALRLTRYRGGAKGPVIVAPGMGTTSRSLTIDTIDVNLAEFLCAAGYDVWLFDYRASPAVAGVRDQCTLDDIALHDYPAAIGKVRAVSGAESVQVIAHCVGSATLLMSLAAGKASGVRSAICSQFTMHVETTTLPWVKAALHLGSLLARLGVTVLDTHYDTSAGRRDRLFEALLRFHPAYRGERCSSPVCRRIRFIYGETFTHDMLNHDTHRLLDEIFGEANLTILRHLSTILRRGHLVDHLGEEAYLPHVDRMAVPITFLQGVRNRIFRPGGSRQTVELLSEANGRELYELKRFPDYAHMDLFIGKRAHRDVFPYLVEQLNRFNH